MYESHAADERDKDNKKNPGQLVGWYKKERKTHEGMAVGGGARFRKSWQQMEEEGAE